MIHNRFIKQSDMRSLEEIIDFQINLIVQICSYFIFDNFAIEFRVYLNCSVGDVPLSDSLDIGFINTKYCYVLITMS